MILPMFTEEHFWDALDRGDLAEAASVLRDLGQLSKGAIELLADLFEPDLASGAETHRLELHRRTAGHPTDPLKRRSIDGAVFRAVEAERVKPGKNLKYALETVAERRGEGVTAVKSHYYRERERLRSRAANS